MLEEPAAEAELVEWDETRAVAVLGGFACSCCERI